MPLSFCRNPCDWRTVPVTGQYRVGTGLVLAAQSPATGLVEAQLLARRIFTTWEMARVHAHFLRPTVMAARNKNRHRNAALLFLSSMGHLNVRAVT